MNDLNIRPKTVKVQITLEEAGDRRVVRTLAGDEAERWQTACSNLSLLGMVHGHQFPHFNWMEGSPGELDDRNSLS